MGNTHQKFFLCYGKLAKPKPRQLLTGNKNFNIFRNDRKSLNNNGILKRGGGILVYTHTDLDVRPLSDELLNSSNDNIESSQPWRDLDAFRPQMIT